MMEGKIDYSPDFLKNLASGAGYDLNSAIAELIDNSIGASAETIKIYTRNGIFKIEDYGENSGMDEKTLKANFFFGGNSSTKGISSAAGKFGVGGKTGVLTIIGDIDTDVKITTHKKGAKPIYATWEVKRGRNNEYYYDFLNDDSISCGTTIEFNYDKDIDMDELINYISIVYCWAIHNNVKLYVNDVLIQPNDPLYRNNNNVIDRKIYTTKTFNVKGEKVDVNITSFNNNNIIPEEELHSWDKGKGKTKSVNTANRSGIYVRTDGRYYTLGNNFDTIMGGTAHASLDGLRIEVCIPKSLWNIIGITWNKGKEIISFTKIESFNTGDCETGVYDYISSIMTGFKNEKETTDDKSAKKILRVVESYNIDTIKANVYASNDGDKDFLTYQDDVLNIDISNARMGQKEIQGIAKALVLCVNEIVKCNCEDKININSILGNFNK